MKTFVQSGNVVTLAAPANVKSGDGVLVGSLFGVAAYDALQGAEVEVALTGVYDLPATGPINAGAPVYWSESPNGVAASGTTLIGAAVAAVGEGGTVCRVRLNGIAVAAA